MERERLHPAKKGAKGRFTERPANSGRKAGVPNKTTRILKEAAILAAEQVGFDRRGKDGLEGYLRYVATRYPEEYLKFLAKLLPLQIVGADNGPIKMELSAAEMREQLEKRGITFRVLDPPLQLPAPGHAIDVTPARTNGHATNGHG